jgi:hypothetical protein
VFSTRLIDGSKEMEKIQKKLRDELLLGKKE